MSLPSAVCLTSVRSAGIGIAGVEVAASGAVAVKPAEGRLHC